MISFRLDRTKKRKRLCDKKYIDPDLGPTSLVVYLPKNPDKFPKPFVTPYTVPERKKKQFLIHYFI